MISGKDIVVLSIQPWDIEIGSNCKNIALQFARNNRVLYVNPPLDRITSLRHGHEARIQKRKHIKRGKLPDIEQVDDNLYVLYPKSLIESINWIKHHALFNYLNRRNSRRYSKNINSAIKRLNFQNIILFNDSSMFLGRYLKEFLDIDQYTYYIRDNLIKVPYWKRHGQFTEPELIEGADLILSNSVHYVDYSKAYNKNSFMVGQGCDFSLFNKEIDKINIPNEIKGIPSPIIGYLGSITSLRLDLDLIRFIADHRKSWSIVLVGPEDEEFKKSTLHELENVYFLGSKSSSELASYINSFDVAINPQAVNDITIGNYPRKIDEYLAMGKPIVATKTKAMYLFKDHTYLASNYMEFIRMIEKALCENSTGLINNRIEFAKSHSWENNVLDIFKKIKESLNTKRYAH